MIDTIVDAWLREWKLEQKNKIFAFLEFKSFDKNFMKYK